MVSRVHISFYTYKYYKVLETMVHMTDPALSVKFYRGKIESMIVQKKIINTININTQININTHTNTHTHKHKHIHTNKKHTHKQTHIL